jgi:flagellar hook-associated protein 1 FlgK
MSSGIFSIGNSALAAAYTALRTAGNNIANVNTPGYTRQTVVLTPQVGSFLGGSFLGQGVAVADVRRTYSEFLTGQAHQATAAAAQSDTRATQIAQVAALFNSPTNGIGAALDNFFSAVQDLTQRPGDAAVRQQLVSAGNLLTQRFNDVGARLQEMRVGSDRQIRLEADVVNRTAQEIATLNDKIALARGNGAMPNDLLDRRDAAIRKLNESIRVTSIAQDDGSVNLFLGNGQPLVVGSQASTFGMRIDPVDPQKLQVGVTPKGGSFLVIESDSIGGGRIGGLMQFRTDDLAAVENDLGRLAIALSTEFNEQHRLGNDASGAAGGDFFAPLAMSGVPARSNASTAAVTVSLADVTQLQASDYRVDFDGSQYTLTRLSDGQQWPPSASPVFTQDGLRIEIGNLPAAAGDRFLIAPFAAASRDFKIAITQASKVAAANPLQTTQPATNLGSLVVDGITVQGPTRDPNLTAAVNVVFTGPTAYEIRSGATVLSSGTYSPGTPISFNGWNLTLRGTPATSDSIGVSASVGGSGDNRNALQLAGIANRLLVDSSTISAGYSNSVARIGGAAQGAQAYAEAQDSILESALAAESAAAGVNLDEEATRLIQYQQQYQAAAKVIAAGRTIFDEILALGR